MQDQVSKGRKRQHDESECTGNGVTALSTDYSISKEDLGASNSSKCVLDGGALLHHVTWNGSTSQDVISG